MNEIRNLFHIPLPLKNKKVFVTAGPTREPIDPIRYISNRSSGKMGYAMAKAAKYFGAEENTIFGNSGLGDLITTCFNHNSRNNQLGTLIAKGNNLRTAQERILGVVEGINSTKIMNEILTQNKIEAPIIYEIYKVLFESKNPKIGIEDLMKRDYSKE